MLHEFLAIPFFLNEVLHPTVLKPPLQQYTGTSLNGSYALCFVLSPLPGDVLEDGCDC